MTFEASYSPLYEQMAGMRRDITDVFTIIHRVRDDGGRKQKGRGTKVRESAAALAAVCYQQRSTMIQSLIGPYTLLNAVLYRTPYHPSSWRNCHYRLYRKYQVHALVIHSQGRLLSKEPRIIVMKSQLETRPTRPPLDPMSRYVPQHVLEYSSTVSHG